MMKPLPLPLRMVPADLYYASAATGAVARLGAAADESVGPAAECRGRLYWFQVRPIEFDSGVLMSARLDGSDERREICLADSHRSLFPGCRMMTIPEGIAVPLQDHGTSHIDDKDQRKWLCILHPGSPPVLQDVRHLPAGSTDFVFDGDYLYFTILESTRGFWETITDDKVGARPTPARFCRVPLR